MGGRWKASLFLSRFSAARKPHNPNFVFRRLITTLNPTSLIPTNKFPNFRPFSSFPSAASPIFYLTNYDDEQKYTDEDDDNDELGKLSVKAIFLCTRCGVCAEILPSFKQLSNKFPKLSFVYADIDECPETTQHIRYTPTFHFYRDGERVDAMFGAGEERLHDRLWLHS